LISRQVQTIFCDEIRYEIGDKISYIGVYSGRLFVDSFPVTLSQLCLKINILTPSNRPVRQLEISVFRDDIALVMGSFCDADLSGAIEITTEAAPVADRILSLQSIVLLEQIVLEGPCVLGVKAKTEEGVTVGPGLSVEQTVSTQPTSTTALI
jgi:hypothetical protein